MGCSLLPPWDHPAADQRYVSARKRTGPVRHRQDRAAVTDPATTPVLHRFIYRPGSGRFNIEPKTPLSPGGHACYNNITDVRTAIFPNPHPTTRWSPQFCDTPTWCQPRRMGPRWWPKAEMKSPDAHHVDLTACMWDRITLEPQRTRP